MLIEPFAPDWLDVLRARADAVAAGQRLHLLIDGAFVPGLHRLIPPERKHMLFASLPGCSSAALDLSPFLMPCELDDKLVQRLLRECSGWPMVSVVQTHEDVGALACRMAAWAVVEADGQHFHLRFADTRRLPAIVGALSADQRAQFLGPAVSWAYIARDGRWQELPFDGVGADHPATAPVFDAQQFGVLVEDSRIDEMLALFAQRNAGPGRPGLQGCELLSLALKAASKAGLSESDLLAWCEFLWLHGEGETPSSAASKFALWLTRR